MKLYENKTTGEYGITLLMLRNLYPHVSLPKGIEKFEDWVGYEEHIPQVREFHRLVEMPPKDGIQQWEEVLSLPISMIVKQLHTEIDNKVYSVTSPFERFRSQYDAREKEAISFKESDYQGECGSLLKAFASSFGITERQATERVLQQSESLRYLDTQIENLRMRKYELKEDMDINQIIEVKRDIFSKIDEIEQMTKSL